MLKIGTLGSKPALRQAEFTQTELARIGVDSELVIINTQGDDIQYLGVDEMEGDGLFTSEIEDALLRGEIDLAVHAMKALSTQTPEGLAISAVSYRDNPADLLIIRPDAYDSTQIFRVKPGATIGTSAAGRKAQMQDIRPDTDLLDLRGDVPTRLQQLREGAYDAIVLAAAGVRNMDLTGLEVIELNPREFLPAPAQGVLAWQTNRDDLPTRRILKQIHHPEVSACTNVERRVLQLFGDDRQLPLGVFCERDANGNFHAFAACRLDGELRRARVSQSTNTGLAEALYKRLMG